MSRRLNAINEELDVAGSFNYNSSMILSEEPLGLGERVAGQSGAAASITVGGTVVVSGLTGMTAQSAGRFLTITGAATPANNGTFLITVFTSATTVQISNPSAATDANNGAISWQERKPYSLEDDINYERTDRSAIKGVAYSAAIPTYTKCTDVATPIPANLSNIAGKTTDAKSIVTNRKFDNVAVSAGNTFVTLSSPGNLKHADAVNRTGVPVNDGADAGNNEAVYAEIIDGYSAGLYVLTGPNKGNRIFGRTRAGSSTSPNSVEVEFRSVPDGADISTSVAYTWEAGQPTSVDIYYGYRDCFDTMSETALRVTLVNGLVGDSGLRQNVIDLQTTIGVDDGSTDLAGLLTNTTNFFPFANLPDATPSVVEALNTLNAQIGNRDYTGSILTDGYTITQSLQQLANAIGGATSVTRLITRVGSTLTPGSVVTVPGGFSYNVDGSNNGDGMMVFWRGVLRDPGTLANGDDYQETSSTTITIYRRINIGDHINFVII
jgi:hypothetical protein